MTRDEAVKIVSKGDPGNPFLNFYAEGFVALLVQLGVLVLDEPKSATVRLYEAFQHTKLEGRLNEVIELVSAAGLKLVDK